MPRRARLDAELVRRGLARSREQAAELIAAGRVTVRGMVAKKPATAVETDAPLLVAEDVDDPRWASRGAHKLIGALDAFEQEGLTVAGRRCLDAGASTGGFTDVLLRRDAREVVAVDVGYGQLVWALRTDERVRVHDRTNVRALEPADIGGPVDLVVADLSFISLKLVLPALLACSGPGADLVPMVKPQFEVGKQRLGPGGVVRDSGLRAEAVLDVVRFAAEAGVGLRGVEASPLPGPSGNVEFFLWLRAGASTEPDEAAELVADAVRRGPQAAGRTGGVAEAPVEANGHGRGSPS
ncbi:TlyA family RNA methyltransferase [Saccharopolyspora sp. MS10]|uniref:TlyA family RNA methyltransferase n=1 Tax=Saccharopolyspora sp. MS10 TaxID=3385973 RepID=UPI0039A2D480